MKFSTHRARLGLALGIVAALGAGAFAAPAFAAGQTIAELFPRTSVAGVVASELGKSTADEATPDELASISRFILRFGDVESITELAPLTGLTLIDLRGNRLKSLDGLDAFGQLDILVVHRNQLADISGLSGSPVTEFAASENPIAAGYDAFAATPNLRSLQLNDAGVTDERVQKIVAAKTLVSVSLNTTEGRSPYPNDIGSFAPFTTLPLVEAVSLAESPRLDSIAGAGSMPALRLLYLNGTAVTDFHELSIVTQSMQAAHMRGRGSVSFDYDAETVTYTHPYVAMSDAGLPQRAPVIADDVPYGGVVDWRPAEALTTITWKVADLKGVTHLEYEHNLFNDAGTKYLWGYLELELDRILPDVTVSFDLAGGAGPFPPQTVVLGETVTAPVENPTRAGFTFEGWVDAEGELFDFDAPLTESVTVYATWTEVVAPTPTPTPTPEPTADPSVTPTVTPTPEATDDAGVVPAPSATRPGGGLAATGTDGGGAVLGLAALLLMLGGALTVSRSARRRAGLIG